MTQIATVTDLVGTAQARVLVRRQSACAHSCEGCGGCIERSGPITALADNAAGARPGDTVRVESESGKVLRLAARVYLLPLALLLAGFFIAAGVFRRSEGAALAAGLVCLAAGLAVNLPLERRLRAKPAVRLRIVEVIRPCSDTSGP